MNLRILFSICTLLCTQISIQAKKTPVNNEQSEQMLKEKPSGYLSAKAIAATVISIATVTAVVAWNIKNASKNSISPSPSVLPTPSWGFPKFSNPSNTCFINATLHGIFSSPAHTHYLQHMNRTQLPKNATLVHEFLGLYDDYIANINYNATLPLNENYAFALRVPALFNMKSTDPEYLNTPVASTGDIRQQDAGEFYGKLFDALDGFDNRLSKTTLTTNKACAHGHLSAQIAAEFFVQLDIPNQEDPIRVSELLTNFQRPEIIDDVQCSACGCATCNNTDGCFCHLAARKESPTYHTSQAQKSISIAPGDHFVIAIKRTQFDFDAMENIKGRTPLTIEQKITLHGHNYKLTGVAFHMGRSANGGHWVALRRVTPFDTETTPPYVFTESFIFLNDSLPFEYGSKLFPELEHSNWLEFTRPIKPRFSGDLGPFLDASLLFYERI